MTHQKYIRPELDDQDPLYNSKHFAVVSDEVGKARIAALDAVIAELRRKYGFAKARAFFGAANKLLVTIDALVVNVGPPPPGAVDELLQVLVPEEDDRASLRSIIEIGRPEWFKPENSSLH